ncbi:MAG: hypothetical protein M1839_002584 [Geoglossum umbratile]|nr:MAG: hypothetical protein M1839_002584 [Geoglossum umbratile]
MLGKAGILTSSKRSTLPTGSSPADTQMMAGSSRREEVPATNTQSSNGATDRTSPPLERQLEAPDNTREVMAATTRTLLGKRDALMEKLRIKKLRQDIASYRQYTDNDEPIPGKPVNPLNLAAPSTPSPSDDNDPDEGSPCQQDPGATGSPRSNAYYAPRGFKVVKPKIYKSQNHHKYREYIHRCEIAFQVQKYLYPTDREKVLYASQFIKGEALDAYSRQEDNDAMPDMTWKEYKTLLKDVLMGSVAQSHVIAVKDYM